MLIGKSMEEGRKQGLKSDGFIVFNVRWRDLDYIQKMQNIEIDGARRIDIRADSFYELTT